MQECKVSLRWDEEGHCWVANSENFRGLVLTNGSLDALMEQVKTAIPDVLEGIQKASIHFFMEKNTEVIYG